MTVFNRISTLFTSVAIIAVCAADPAFAAAPAPGPISGVGLPILAIGYGAYWLVKRYRRKTD